MTVLIETTSIRDVLVVRPNVLVDDRGSFTEVFRQDTFLQAGLPDIFVQLNESRSTLGVLRGLHFQWEPPMGKLMRVTHGCAFLVAVDLRIGSPTLGRSFTVTLDAKDSGMLWAPAGFARGFCVLSETAVIEYLTTGVYNERAESAVRWDDPQVGIRWPVTEPVLSPRDSTAESLSEWLLRPEAASFRFQTG